MTQTFDANAPGRGEARGWSLAALAIAFALAGCERAEPLSAQRVVGGDPDIGRKLIAAVGCGVCHRIPGLLGANGVVGPPLAGFAQRQYIGGVVPNHPANLVRWVREAPSMLPNTAMPDMPLSEAQARDVAAYLYTLR